MIVNQVLVIASAIIKNKEDKILLLQRSKKGSFPGCWQLVEGKMEKDESPIKTIKREIKEEIGAKVLKAGFNNVFYKKIKAKGLKYLCFRIVFNTLIFFKEIKTSDEHSTFGWFDKNEITDLKLLPGTENILNKLYV